MQLVHTAPKTNAKLYIIHQESSLDQGCKERIQKDNLLTIAMNMGESLQIIINDIPYEFPVFSIVPLFINQAFEFKNPHRSPYCNIPVISIAS